MTKPERPAGIAQGDRKRIANAAMLWGGIALSGVIVIAILSVWHLVRRGRVIRASLAQPRPITPLGPQPADTP